MMNLLNKLNKFNKFYIQQQQQYNIIKRTYCDSNTIILKIENINRILNNLPDPTIEKDKFYINDDYQQHGDSNLLSLQKSTKFKGLLDTLRFPHEIYQDKLDGIISEDNKQYADEQDDDENSNNLNEKQEFIQVGGRKATIHSRTGSIYDGQVNENGIPDGFGELDLKNGDFYLGQFVNGKKEGKGRLISTSGCQYDGDWKDDMHHGKGRFDENDKQISYQGQWHTNERHGLGILTDQTSEIKGIWEKDQLVFGHEVKKDIALEYYGQFKNDQWNGIGKVSFPDSSIYKGEFKDGIPFGKGKFLKYLSIDHDEVENNDGSLDEFKPLKLEKEEQYEPQIIENDNWNRGIICGQGKIYRKGWCCEGIWNNQGEITDATISMVGHGVYKGEINTNFLPNGNGKEYLENGDYYNGSFVDGKRDGYGEIIWSDKSTYKGDWLNGLRIGRGEIVSSDQQTHIQADFKEIQLDDRTTRLNGKGTLKRLSDGSTYVGELENCIPEGYGELTIPNSNIIKKGIWKNGKLIN